MIKCLFSVISLLASLTFHVQGNSIKDIPDTVALAQEAVRDTVTASRLNLFSEDDKAYCGKAMLEYIEAALYRRTLGETPEDDRLSILQGEISDFKKINASTPYSIRNTNARTLTVEWEVDGHAVIVSLPVGYDTASGGLSRAEVENNFIAKLRDGSVRRLRFEGFSADTLKPYSDSLYILPGESYQIDEINRNVYFSKGEKGFSPIWDAGMLQESVADMFIYPSAVYDDVQLDLIVLKHEYGEKATLELPLNRLLAVCEQEGCIPYWGLEKREGEIIEGSLFLYNEWLGYDHVIKVEMNAADVINGRGKVKARASLYVPTNNVGNLFQPYVRKSEKERIVYDW